MERREVLAERRVERGRGFMPGVSINPSRTLFTAGLTGRNPDGAVTAGGMAAQTRRTMEGGRLLYISGQVAWDASGNIVGKGDVGAQAKQTFQNLRGVLQAAGGDFRDLMKITTYITRIEDVPAVAKARGEVFQGELPASTLIVVTGLFHPDFLIEVEGVAAV